MRGIARLPAVGGAEHEGDLLVRGQWDAARVSPLQPPVHVGPQRLAVPRAVAADATLLRRTPQTPKSSPSVKLRTTGDSTWTMPVESCVWIGEMKRPRASIPIPAGTVTRRPSRGRRGAGGRAAPFPPARALEARAARAVLAERRRCGSTARAPSCRPGSPARGNAGLHAGTAAAVASSPRSRATATKTSASRAYTGLQRITQIRGAVRDPPSTGRPIGRTSRLPDDRTTDDAFVRHRRPTGRYLRLHPPASVWAPNPSPGGPVKVHPLAGAAVALAALAATGSSLASSRYPGPRPHATTFPPRLRQSA